MSIWREGALRRRHSECPGPDPGVVTESFRPPNPGHSISASSFILLLALISETILLTNLYICESSHSPLKGC